LREVQSNKGQRDSSQDGRVTGDSHDRTRQTTNVDLVAHLIAGHLVNQNVAGPGGVTPVGEFGPAAVIGATNQADARAVDRTRRDQDWFAGDAIKGI